MCEHREHKYRITITVRGKDQDVIFYAKGMAEAFAKADGWAHKNYPDEPVAIATHRVGYHDDETAREHGAVFER